MSETDEVKALYARLAALPLDEQRSALRSTPPEMRSEVWAYHLTTVLQTCTDLSDEQRREISAGIDYVKKREWIGIGPTDPEWSARQAELAAHKKRGEAIFPPQLIYSIFFRIGPEPGR